MASRTPDASAPRATPTALWRRWRSGAPQRRRQGRELWQRLLRILAFAHPYRGRIALCLGIILLAAVFSLIFPLGIRMLLDTALAGENRTLLHLLAAGLFVVFVVRAVLTFFGRYLLELTGERMVIDLRTRLYRHLHDLDTQYFNDQRIGDLTSRLTSDAAAIRNAVTETSIGAFLQLFQLAGAVAIMLWINWRLTLLVALVAPAATLVARSFAPLLRDLAKGVQQQTGQTMAVAQESLSAVHVVKAYARSDYETDRFTTALRRLFDVFRRSARTNSLFRAIINLVTATASIAIFWYGGLEVLSGRLTAGDLVAFLFYSQSIAGGLGQLAQLYGELSYAAGASDRVFEVLDTEPAVRERPDAVALPAVRGEVAFRDVWFGYNGGAPVLRGVDFTARPGETVALVGLSGAGKTTVLHLLSRFFDPLEGRVTLDGHDLRELRLEWLRRQVALVSQDVFLFGASVRENIRYGRLDASDAEVEGAAVAANADEFIRALPDGYDTEVGERGVKLSGGQRQRVSLARAFLKNAPILVLDEATSAVDAASEGHIRDAMTRLRRRRTTLVVAHRLASVMDADRILVMEEGCIAEAGTHAELLNGTGLYRRLLHNQYQAGVGEAAVAG